MDLAGAKAVGGDDFGDSTRGVVGVSACVSQGRRGTDHAAHGVGFKPIGMEERIDRGAQHAFGIVGRVPGMTVGVRDADRTARGIIGKPIGLGTIEDDFGGTA